MSTVPSIRRQRIEHVAAAITSPGAAPRTRRRFMRYAEEAVDALEAFKAIMPPCPVCGAPILAYRAEPMVAVDVPMEMPTPVAGALTALCENDHIVGVEA